MQYGAWATSDDYLTKPFSFVVLMAHLRALVRRGATERPAVLQAGDLALDPGAQRCSRGGADIELTRGSSSCSPGCRFSALAMWRSRCRTVETRRPVPT